MIVPIADRLSSVKAYYFVKKLEEIKQLRDQGYDIISFAIGSPDMAPSQATVDALVETANNEDSHGYQMYRGIPQLREAMAAWYKRTYGVTISPDTEILPMMGSKEAILHLTMAFVNEGDEVLIPDPGYPTYSSVTNLVKGKIRLYSLTEKQNWYPDFDYLEQEDLSNVKLMWVNYPHMPTGVPPDMDVFQRLIAFAKKHNILVCHDNPYSMVLNEDKPTSILSVPGAREVAVELNSLSKSHNMAGWRVGMLAGSADYLNSALTVKSNIDSGMFLGIQKAAIAALENSDEWHANRNAIYRERREWVYKILDKIGFEYNTNNVGMFVWAKPTQTNAISSIEQYIDDLLHEKHIFFTPGFIFGKGGEGYLRASLCVPLEKIKEAYNRIK